MIYNKEKNEIISEREFSDLDKFAVEFLEIVEKHCDYVIISGYVSILLGRSRSSEDIDIFIKRISKEKFNELYKELMEKGFWCINAEDSEELYGFLEDKLAIRFAYKGEGIPNFEVKFPKDVLDEDAFNKTIKVKINNKELIISSLERQIAFKKYYLCSDKDIEDAKYIEKLFEKDIDLNKVEEIKKRIEERQNGK